RARRGGGRGAGRVIRQTGASTRPLCCTYGSKSFTLRVASGSSLTTHTAAVHVSLTGRGCPRRFAEPDIRPHVVATLKSYGRTTTSRSQSAIRVHLRRPQSAAAAPC